MLLDGSIFAGFFMYAGNTQYTWEKYTYNTWKVYILFNLKEVQICRLVVAKFIFSCDVENIRGSIYTHMKSMDIHTYRKYAYEK